MEQKITVTNLRTDRFLVTTLGNMKEERITNYS